MNEYSLGGLIPILKKRRAQPEHKLQVECITWFKLQYPKRIIMAIPNGMFVKNIVIAKKAVDEGLKKGMPDIFIPEPMFAINILGERVWLHGLWIEMKNGTKGVLSDEQLENIAALNERGYVAEVATSFNEFQEIVNRYFPKRR